MSWDVVVGGPERSERNGRIQRRLGSHGEFERTASSSSRSAGRQYPYCTGEDLDTEHLSNLSRSPKDHLDSESPRGSGDGGKWEPKKKASPDQRRTM
jgi:hypothetical protein